MKTSRVAPDVLAAVVLLQRSTCCLLRVTCIVVWAVLLFFPHTSAWALAIGDRVQANSNVNVRSTPAGTLLGTQPNGALGTIIGGPQTATLNGTSFVWWQVNWDNNPDGWCAQDFLTRVVPAPSISSVSPNPVTGSNSAQPFTINGSNFVSGANVTLRDLTAGQPFPNRVASSFSSTQIVLNPNFTTAAAQWSVEVINPDGQSSGQFSFTVQAPAAPAPQITSVSPNPVTGSNSAQPFTINGSNFVAGCNVTLRDVTTGEVFANRGISSFSNTQVVINPNFTTAAHTWSVEVINPDGRSSGQFTFTVQAPSTLAPQISSVSPNPVPGLNSAQPFTINGSNFVSGATVTLRDLRTGEVFPNRPISFLSSTQIVINPNFTVAEATWSVEVINPGGASSGQMQFPVVAPDLIVENVTFNPASVLAGNTFTIEFDVRNIGSGNAPPTQARLRLSSDNILTFSDLPLSPLDVSIPAVAAGSSTHFIRAINVPSTTPQGSYFVGVFADWDNRGNQSDVTNDARVSLSQLTVTGTGVGVPRPAITVQPQSQTVTAGDTVTFTVGVSGTRPFSYRWLRDGHPFAGTTTQSDLLSDVLTLTNISTNLAGSYTALISNLGGTAATTPATLTVNPNGVPLPAAPTPGQTRCRPDVLFDRSLPTIVITHGLQL